MDPLSGLPRIRFGPDHRAGQRTRKQPPPRPELDHRDQHDDAVVIVGQRECAGQRAFPLGGSPRRRQQQLLDDFGRTESTRCDRHSQRPRHRAGQRDRLADAGGCPLGLTTGQSAASTTQNGAVNANVPVSLCAINVGLAGTTSSDCNLTGTKAAVAQQGIVDANVPVTVCDVIVEIDGSSNANRPREPNAVSQHGQLADVYVPATACGIIAAVYGTATVMCTPERASPSRTTSRQPASARAPPLMASCR